MLKNHFMTPINKPQMKTHGNFLFLLGITIAVVSGSQGPCASFHLFFRVWKASETLDLIFECTLYHKGVLGGGESCSFQDQCCSRQTRGSRNRKSMTAAEGGGEIR